MLPILDNVPWQMTPGERAALEGVLAQVKPRLAIEIGTAEGGSLRGIARHSEQVLSFDLVPPTFDVTTVPNVTFHTGDNHQLLPEVLAKLAAEGAKVDFVLVDGDHTADGVERDLRDLLNSAAIENTVIVVHDTMNDIVRSGLERIDAAAEPKVAYLDLNFVSGRLNYGGPFHHQLWGGLGLIVVGPTRSPESPAPTADQGAYTMFELIAPVRDTLIAQERADGPSGPGRVREALSAGGPPALSAEPPESPVDELRAAVIESQRQFDEIRNSKSWRLTAPLRAAGRAVRDRRA
jgi:hypothetical protein